MLEMVINARAADLGHGLTVRRVLPFAKRRNVGPFVFLESNKMDGSKVRIAIE